jgi:hypothetical protein
MLGQRSRRALLGVSFWVGASGCTAEAVRSRALEPSTGRGPRGERVWDYQVRAEPRARVLQVVARFPAQVPAWFGVDRFADPFLDGLELQAGVDWRRVEREGRRWHLPECELRGCVLRYRFELGAAAAVIDRVGFAAHRGGALLAPPSTWLLHPSDYSGSDRYRFSVESAPGEAFFSGVWSERASNPPGSLAERATHAADAASLFEAPYSAFGRFTDKRLHAEDATLELALPEQAGALAVSLESLGAAAADAAWLVARYYGHFPVHRVALLALPAEGSGLMGRQLGNGGASILWFVGRQVRAEEVARDATLVHELFHLGLPTLPRKDLWFSEGLASYEEAIARARAGWIRALDVWQRFVMGMPKGQPRPGDEGLEGATSWGRVYWGGAAFCLLADVMIRVQTHNLASLDDSARAILAKGGDTSVRRTLDDVLAAGDSALPSPRLAAQYAEYRSSPVPFELEALWRKLGVSVRAGEVTLDDGAEWASVRRAITEPPSVQSAQGGLSAPGVPKSPL